MLFIFIYFHFINLYLIFNLGEKKNFVGLTHVISNSENRDEVRIALGINYLYLVKDQWLYDSIDFWEWQDEKKYAIGKYPPYRYSPPKILNKSNIKDYELLDEKATKNDYVFDFLIESKRIKS